MPTLDELNDLDQEQFVAALGGVFEHSPWVAGAAWRERPFASVAGLHGALVDAVRDAPLDHRLALIRAHPELADRQAQRGELTDESSGEQASAGLHRLSARQADALARLNHSYHERFGFPLIVCVREHTIDSILTSGAARLENSREHEIEVALREIAKIARLRLADVVEVAA